MNRSQSKLIMGSALGLAALAVAIDHTRHPLPEPQAQTAATSYEAQESPCSLDGEAPPCALDSANDSAPCSLGESPCSLGEDAPPCSLDTVSPCSL